ncbi:FecR family protein [Sphingobacterium nematocida]|uniref:FecR family protein n=1 Tax=Sphingobacterium nematocida TaxID=1513896 RepID=A0A1T5ATL1_9SPHI|nr:FecR family protein [Sphingobacterium nematocida]SKB38338.1 FecR family protein [Sphingobacterium nematocida]
MNSKERIKLLINKFEEGLIDEDEFRELVEWYNSFDDSEAIISTQKDIQITDIKERMFDNILKQADIPSNGHLKVKNVKRLYYKWSSIAAAILLTILGIWWSWQQRHHSIEQIDNTSFNETIQPGTNKATLKLADGTMVELRELEGGLLTDEKLQYADGTEVLDPHMKSALSENMWLELETPKGGTYRVTLDDGTQVWLNAGSKLKYPAHFDPTADRLVEIQGEAYFKVKSRLNAQGKKIPFRVKANRQLIQVIGTEFNVSDYSHLKYTHTTLIEGKVSIENLSSSVLLKPGQQWQQSKKGTSIQEVDTESVVAWKENKFNFANKSLEDILDEIALWYNIEIEYQSTVPHVELVGDAYRNSDFNLILRLLQVAKVDYTLDTSHRKLIIK